MPNQLPDLGQIKATHEAAEKAAALAQEQERQAVLEQHATAWDRSMTRAFKGILSAPERRAQLVRSANA